MRWSLAAVFLLATVTRADIYRPISFDGCRTYGLDCTECASHLGQSSKDEACVAEALAEGRELACDTRHGAMRSEFYCAPGVAKSVVATSGMHWLLGPGLALLAVLGAVRCRRRKAPTV